MGKEMRIYFSKEHLHLCLCLWVLTVFPLLVWADYQHMTAAKFAAFALPCALWMPAAILLQLRQKQPLPRPNAAELLLLALLFWALLSALCSPYRSHTLQGLGHWDGLLPFVLYLLTALLLRRSRGLPLWLLRVIACSALLQSGIAFLQILGADPLSLYPGGYTDADAGIAYVGRYLGTVGNIDYLGSYCCLTVPLLLFGGMGAPRKTKLLLWTAAVCLLLLLAEIRVSAAWLGISAGCGLLLPCCLPRPHRKKAALLLLLLLLLLLVLVFCFGESWGGTFAEAAAILHGEIRDDFGSSRVRIWKEGLSSAGAHLLLGTGPGSRSAHFDITFQRETATGLLQAKVTNGHSEYLDTLLELGIPGLLLYLSLLGCVFVQSLRHCSSCAVRLLCAALLAYCIQALFCSRSIVVAPIFWVLLGLLLAELRSKTEPDLSH